MIPAKVISYRKDGLGARLINLIDAAHLAQEFDLPLDIYWPDCPGHCTSTVLEKLFSLNSLKTLSKSTTILNRTLATDELSQMYEPSSFYVDRRLINLGKKILIRSTSSPHFIQGRDTYSQLLRCKEIFESLELNEYTKIKIKKTAPQDVELNTLIGIHIRRGDMATHPKGYIRCVPLGEYISLIEQKKNEKFLVCTDDVAISSQLQRDYGARIFTTNTASFERSDDDLLDAFLEMYLLSKTKCIFGGKSAFTDAAAIIGNTKLANFTAKLNARV